MRLKKLLAVALCAGMLTLSTQAEALKFFAQADGMTASNTPYGDNASAAHRVQVGDAKIYYESYGQGDPIVLLHGGGLGSAYEMGCFADPLKRNHQVIVISSRGHGRSDIGHTPFTLDQRADDIRAVLKDAKIKKPATVIGFSDGGYSAYAFAAKYPNSVKKVVTIGAGEVLLTNKFFVFNLEDWKKYDADFIAQQQSLMPEPERWQEMLHMYEDMWNGAVISKDMFSKIKCPVLLINGEKDQNSPLLTAFAAYYELPDAHLSIIPNAGHQCQATNFDAVWSVVKPFIEE